MNTATREPELPGSLITTSLPATVNLNVIISSQSSADRILIPATHFPQSATTVTPLPTKLNSGTTLKAAYTTSFVNVMKTVSYQHLNEMSLGGPQTTPNNGRSGLLLTLESQYNNNNNKNTNNNNNNTNNNNNNNNIIIIIII